MAQKKIQLHRFLFVMMIVAAVTMYLSCDNREDREAASGPAPSNQIEEESEAMPEPAIEGSTLTITELKEIIAPLDTSIRKNILARPVYFLELLQQAAAEPDSLTVLVDKEHGLSSDYKPEELVSLNNYSLSVSRKDLSLSRSIMPWVLALDEAARAEGITLVFSSSYRSWEYQKGLYERYVKRHGKEEADRFSARPGHSQHQLGTVVDFGSITEAFAYTDAGKWMAQHAGRFGFSLSYPQGAEEETGYMWEPWHFRYVGPEVIRLQEAFFAGSQQKTLEFIHSWKNR